MSIDLTLKSTAITNRQASPRVINNPGAGAPGVLRVVRGYLASVTASLSITSVIRMVEVPSNCRVHSVVLDSEAQTAGAFSVGVYRTNADGGLVAFTNSDQFFTAAVSCASAVISQQCVLKATTLNTIAKMDKQLWDAIGMAADPKSMLDICLTCTTTAVTTGTGAIGLSVSYTV
ncbi:MAG: hypothetical protein V4457_05965 [Pseudomonadota bacterium]